jgi:ABC-type uncharacterized transport system permease subunit
MRFLIVFLFFGIVDVSAQDSISLKKTWELSISTNSSWSVDNLNQVFVADKDLLKKFDSEGNQLFVQSVKNFGTISEIDTKNPMKVMLFSEQQQYLIFLDNTLSKQFELELSDYNLNYVTHVAASIQPDKIWVFDQQNSKISLIASKQQQSISLQNVAGLLNIKNVLRIVEKDEQLLLFDAQKGLFVFDLFGTLKSQVSAPDALWMDFEKNYLYLLVKNQLEIINMETNSKRIIKLPENDVIKFGINQNNLILQTKTNLYHYLVEIF